MDISTTREQYKEKLSEYFSFVDVRDVKLSFSKIGADVQGGNK